MLKKTNIVKTILSAPVSAWRSYRAWPFTRQLIVAASVLLVCVTLSAIARPVQFSYAGNNCYESLVIAPGLQLVHADQGYAVSYGDTLQVAGVAFSAGRVCINPTEAPKSRSHVTVKSSLFGVPLLGQHAYRVGVSDLPAVNYHILKNGVAATRPLTIPLNVTDRTFAYQLAADGKTAACVPRERAISCDIEALGLKQGTKYRLALVRQFNGHTVKTLMDQEVTTLSPVSVLESTIKAGETVYAKPTSVVFKMDKAITTAKAKLEKIEGDKRSEVQQSIKLNGKIIEVTYGELPRSQQYQLTLTEVIASDGSSLLDKSYVLPFSMSGGPRVTGVNIGRYGVTAGATVIVTFDQHLSATQDVSPQVKLAGGAGNLSRSGNQIRFSTASAPLCGDFSASFTRDIQSEHGISGDSAWNYTSRTICHTVNTIGYSSKGRAITAYAFGSGSQSVLYVGAIHGNERGTYLLMSEWIDELESKARTIPADKRVVVIPAVNRDGLAAGTRRNAQNVDLNRNFPTVDWKKDVTMPGGENVVGGGGASALSEPESVALANFTRSLSPQLVLTYHSVGWLVTPNEAGISGTYASKYSRLSGYYVSPKSAAGTTFEYDTTGAYEDWLYEGPKIPTILVELGSHTSSQSQRNFGAMWEMMK